MRAIVLDELRPPDMEKLTSHLQAELVGSSLPDVFWLELPPELLAPEQAAHEQCGPHRVAAVLELDSLKLELLVRSATSLRCSCTDYATTAQRDWLLAWVDGLIDKLELST
ncbi:MAG: hypothetical protein K9K66_16765 [Desulfarculaceae bacterium]|nr:hypothetical protein [Desulfarculaceae bacterium]MCF8072617.1 hypothetical protein [Desulfarculaceae bacterium]MCF8103311.1 hypothetical protein [Desulfarculaceae bacterium]MCF8117793.1 hypothetical protein [Desulfarculaceae bacterium]